MNPPPNQKKVSDFVGQELTWVRTHWLKSQYELRAEDLLLATLTRRSILGSFATGESDEGCWTFKRVGFLHPRITIRISGQETDIAVFKNATWKSGGSLELSDGRKVLVTTNFWQTKLEFKTEQKVLLLTFKIQGLVHSGATLRIESEAAKMLELPWMVMLGWYLIIMIQDEASAASVTVF